VSGYLELPFCLLSERTKHASTAHVKKNVIAIPPPKIIVALSKFS
jgi:hypothetical protein